MWSRYLALGLLFTSNAFSITFKEWTALSVEKKVEYIEDNSSQASYDDKKWSYRTTSPSLLRAIKKDQNRLVKEFASYRTEAYLEVEDDNYALVGDVEVSSDVYYSEDNKLIAVSFHYAQRGCSHQDDNGDYTEESGFYMDYTEAHKNNCFDNDVSWSGFSFADSKFKELSHSDYMEWSGH